MQLNVTSVVLFLGGAVLLYAGIKNVDPRQLLTNVLQGKEPDWKPATPGGRGGPGDRSRGGTFDKPTSTPKPTQPPYLSV